MSVLDFLHLEIVIKKRCNSDNSANSATVNWALSGVLSHAQTCSVFAGLGWYARIKNNLE